MWTSRTCKLKLYCISQNTCLEKQRYRMTGLGDQQFVWAIQSNILESVCCPAGDHNPAKPAFRVLLPGARALAFFRSLKDNFIGTICLPAIYFRYVSSGCWLFSTLCGRTQRLVRKGRGSDAIYINWFFSCSIGEVGQNTDHRRAARMGLGIWRPIYVC